MAVTWALQLIHLKHALLSCNTSFFLVGGMQGKDASEDCTVDAKRIVMHPLILSSTPIHSNSISIQTCFITSIKLVISSDTQRLQWNVNTSVFSVCPAVLIQIIIPAFSRGRNIGTLSACCQSKPGDLTSNLIMCTPTCTYICICARM